MAKNVYLPTGEHVAVAPDGCDLQNFARALGVRVEDLRVEKASSKPRKGPPEEAPRSRKKKAPWRE